MSTTTSITPLRLITLYEVSRQINSQLNLDKLLDEIMDQAIALLRAEKGLVLLREAEGGELGVKVARQMDRQNLIDAVAMSRSVIERVEKEGEPVLLQKVPDIPGEDATKSMVMYKLKSIICVPLKAKDQLIGAIYLDTTDKACFFKDADLEFLEAFANLACIAIENARSYQEIEHLNANLEQKVAQRTRELQEKNAQLTDANQKLRDTQMQLIRSEKMASLGNLAAGVAHEINNPLGSLNGNMDVFVRSFDAIRKGLESDDPEARKKAYKAALNLENLSRVSKTACERISHIVRALRNFARLDEEEFKQVDLHEGLESTLVLLENRYRDRIEIIKEYGELPQIFCQAAQINQVFMNLLLNACEAILETGKIYIRTAMSGNEINVSFRDTGVGIAPEQLAKIYDPGYTTKGVRVGVGLGLAICYKIMEEHGGRIVAESRVGEGSTFTLTLPL